jgi:hypothetical protein
LPQRFLGAVQHLGRKVERQAGGVVATVEVDTGGGEPIGEHAEHRGRILRRAKHSRVLRCPRLAVVEACRGQRTELAHGHEQPLRGRVGRRCREKLGDRVQLPCGSGEEVFEVVEHARIQRGLSRGDHRGRVEPSASAVGG